MMAKNNERVWRILKFSLVIAGLLVSIAIAYGSLNYQVQDNTVTIEKHETKLEQQGEDVVELKSDVKHIRKAVDRIEKKL